MKLTFRRLEALYNKYNMFKYISPDPLELVYHFDKVRDREIAGLIASSLAYGNVKQILKSVTAVLKIMGYSPYNYMKVKEIGLFYKEFSDFRHRFTSGEDLSNFLCGIKTALNKYGSLNELFCQSLKKTDNSFSDAAAVFSHELNIHNKKNRSYLLPSPEHGSACKRLMLYFRWMVRRDEVDPGCWNSRIPESMLIMPLDIHIYKISKNYGLTSRKQADFRTALEITENFKRLNRSDPVKYDFVLSRFGIRNELCYDHIDQY
ncbi:MAG: TIGR02757 family protein [Victivallales bacterium]|nr:TIGR02757 family protein [Victivallales bacterium]